MHTDPIRPTTKASFTNGRDWRYYGLALAVLCTLSVQAHAQTTPPCTEVSFCKPAFNLSIYYGGTNVKINKCATNTTTPNNMSNQCAWADAVTMADEATVFLACPLTTTGPIALCYYGGQPGAPYNTPSCTFSQGGSTAECNCYEVTSSTPGAGQYSYVEITAILNENIYNQTTNTCGMNGIKCLNALDVMNGTTTGKTVAPVCATLNKATSGSGAMFPGADLISDFSQIQIPQIPGPPPGNMGSFTQSCPIPGSVNSGNPYAACMTAPCKLTNKTDPATGWPLAKCTCPTFNGPNQVGNPQIGNSPSNKSCTPNPYVWSSAYIQ